MLNFEENTLIFWLYIRGEQWAKKHRQPIGQRFCFRRNSKRIQRKSIRGFCLQY